MRHTDLLKRVLAKRLQESLVNNKSEIVSPEIVKISDEVSEAQDKSVLLQSSEEKSEEKTLEKVESPVSEEASKKKNNFSSKKKKTANSAT